MIDVTCAIIRNEDNEVLVVQRGEESDHPLKWEFPGGKTHEGESHEECIIREIHEELAIDIVICSMLEPVKYDYGIKQINLIPFICDTLDELPFLSEHNEFMWVLPEKLKGIDFSEADVIVAERYLSTLKDQLEGDHSGAESDQQSYDESELKSIIQKMMSMKEADWMAISAIENPVIFRKLIEYSFNEDKKLAFRASWILSKVCDKDPEMIFPYLDDLVETLSRIDNESVERSFLRILSFSELERLNVKQHGVLADHCFAALKSGLSAIAIKAYAMEVLYKLTLIYPDLGSELAASIRIIMEEGSAGMVARGQMILKKISEIPLDR